jgi:SAM-dependent methyltransferase
MTFFRKYASYYDLLYKDKDYIGETDYVHKLIQQYSKNTRSILDLGCGTGRHAFEFSKKDYSVTGIDISKEMLAMARSFKKQKKHNNPKFFSGDIRYVRLGEKFDAVVSLFHTLSYQTANSDIEGVFETAKVHLKPNGIFLFDCWYGPAVITDKPALRVKRIEEKSMKIIRIAEPEMYPNDNIVDVHYEIIIDNRKTGEIERFTENHRMRYLFKPEIERFLEESGFALITCEEWLSGKKPGFDTWNVVFIAKG